MDAGVLQETYDVIVVGSGAAGLSAALAAAAGGASVVVVEASDRFGGATAVSGGQAWLPSNHVTTEPDDYAAARTYCIDHSPGRDPEMIDAFLDAAPGVARFIEDHTPLQWRAMSLPDSFAEAPGGRLRGRNLEVAPIGSGLFSPWYQWVWSPPYPAVLTNEEVSASDMIFGGAPPMDRIRERMSSSQVCLGVGLVVGLLRGAHDVGVHLARSTRTVELTARGSGASEITGVVVEQSQGARRTIEAGLAVVLATGGFEHDPEMARRFLRPSCPSPASPPTARGDGLRLAALAGAMLANLSESWCWPVRLGGRTWDDQDGTAAAELMMAERALPHTVWVNRAGRRFVNEASHNCALSFAEIDPSTNVSRNLPAFVIGDAQYRARYTLAGTSPGHPAPGSVVEADTVSALAVGIGVDPEGLVETIGKFNAAARHGEDPAFGRGQTAYDQTLGDSSAPHPNLGTVERPPFFALEVHPGTVGTQGGPVTDAQQRVLHWEGDPIAGLFAAGNTAASIIGPGTVSSGLTIGLALTTGHTAGVAAAARD